MPRLCDAAGAVGAVGAVGDECEAVPGDAKKITFVLLKAYAYVEEIFWRPELRERPTAVVVVVGCGRGGLRRFDTVALID